MIGLALMGYRHHRQSRDKAKNKIRVIICGPDKIGKELKDVLIIPNYARD